MGRIHDISELVASGAAATEVLARLEGELIDLLHLRAARYERGPAKHLMLRIEHDGHVIFGDKVWGVHIVGLPGPEIELVVQSRGEMLGRFVLTPTAGYPVSRERRVVAVALADQAGAALRPQLHAV